MRINEFFRRCAVTLLTAISFPTGTKANERPVENSSNEPPFIWAYMASDRANTFEGVAFNNFYRFIEKTARYALSIEQKREQLLNTVTAHLNGANEREKKAGDDNSWLLHAVDQTFQHLGASPQIVASAEALAKVADAEKTNAYHARAHYREGFVMMLTLLKLDDALYPDDNLTNAEKCILLLSYLGHDLKHIGGAAQADFAFEIVSATETVNHLKEAGITDKETHNLTNFMIFSTYPKPLFPSLKELSVLTPTMDKLELVLV